MKILRRATSILGLLAALASFALAQISYKPAEVIAVTDAYRTYRVNGFVVLDVSIGADGAVSGTSVLRALGTLGSAADSSVRTWKFRPAEGPNGPLPSEMTVIFVYRPRNSGFAQAIPPEDFKPVLPEPRADSADPDYVPPGIVSVSYPKYPVNSVTAGSVIIQVTVGPAGNVEATDVLRAMGPFTALAVDAVGKWQFQAAMLRGRSVESKLAVAFLFQPPETPYHGN